MKKFLVSLITACFILSLASCSSEEVSSESQSASASSQEASDEESYEFVSEAPMVDPSLIEKFPEEKISHSVMDDGNYYLKVQTISGNEAVIREFAVNGKDAYATLIHDDSFEWFYSDGKTTFCFDDEKKLYEIYVFGPLGVDFGFKGTKLEEGECSFFDVKCKYVKYALDENMSIMHFYRKEDDSWLGFQYMHKNEYEDANLVLAASDEYPSHVRFSIPEDYKYYFEEGDNEMSIDWSL